MSIELRIPEVGESITEVEIGDILVPVGQSVNEDEPIMTLETDKVTQELLAPTSGTVTEILKASGDVAEVGELIVRMQAGEVTKASPVNADATQNKAPAAEKPASSSTDSIVMPAAAAEAARSGVALSSVSGTGPGGRVLKEDVKAASRGASLSVVRSETQTSRPAIGSRDTEVVPMTRLRKRIAENLVAAQQSAALLTTFQECDMTETMALRAQYKEAFLAKHDVKLGFMSFFVKAAVEALKNFPLVNAQIKDQSVVYHHYQDIGVAIGGGKGLVVPVLRNAEAMGFADIELAIMDFATRAKSGNLKVEELQGGTFTISNGGVYGSMLSTPIINPPQSAILGLHAIKDRPAVVNGEVKVRKMMYLALSYDHRIIDGREAVSFLGHIRDLIENPSRILLEV